MADNIEVENFDLQKKIDKIHMKISNLIELRTENEISIDEFKKRNAKLKEELKFYEDELLNQQLVPKEKRNDELDLERIKLTLKEVLDFSGAIVDNDIVEKFVAKIIPQGNNHFSWFINLSALTTEKLIWYWREEKTTL